MAYTDIQDNSTITLDRLKAFLKINDTDLTEDLEFVLDLHLKASKEAADNYCQDVFETVPAGIEVWILQIAGLWWSRVAPTLKASQYQDLGQVQWTFEYHDYYHLIKHYRREVGYA